MNERRECGNCGAVPSRANAKFCEYCGKELPRPPAVETVRVEVTGPFGDLEERFARLQAHPSYDQWMRHTPATSAPAVGMYGSALFLGIFVAMAAVMTLVFASVAGPMALVPGGMAVFGLIMMMRSLGKATRYSRSPLEREPVVVLDERTRVAGGGHRSSARTSYYATLQFPGGGRRELSVTGRLAGAITKGDVGIAYSKADVLISFRRVDV